MQYNILAIIDITLAGIILYVCIYHLFMYIKRPSLKINLAFSISAIAFSIYTFLNAMIYSADSAAKGTLCYHLQIPVADFIVIGLVWFLYHYSSFKNRKTTIVFTCISIFLFVLSFILWNTKYTVELNKHLLIMLSFFDIYKLEVYQGSNGIIFILQFILFICSFGFISINVIRNLIKTKNLQDILLILGFILFFIAVVNDISVSEKAYSFIFIGQYAYFVIILGLAYILQNDFITLHRNIEDLNKTLDLKAKEKTRELQINVKKLQTTLSELKTTQSRLMQSEKMAGIGQLAAGIAHEINNPMGFIINNLNVMNKYLNRFFNMIDQFDEQYSSNEDEEVKKIEAKINDIKEKEDFNFIKKDVFELVNETAEGADRVKNIVLNLRDFAHPIQDDLHEIDINKEIEQSLSLLKNELKYNCKIQKELNDIPKVICNKGQVSQIFVNLIVNSIQAIGQREDGIIAIKSYARDKSIYIELSDNGKGIPKENLNKIFDPFFTTKEIGKGTGLGLSIIYGIIKDHKWDINVQSEVGKGTTFIIQIPV